jgi:hypothetical protein
MRVPAPFVLGAPAFIRQLGDACVEGRALVGGGGVPLSFLAYGYWKERPISRAYKLPMTSRFIQTWERIFML